MDTAPLLVIARHDVLRGVGDVTRGEWIEIGEKAVHLRRRLSVEEDARVGPVIDMRGTSLGRGRVFRAKQWLPVQFWEMADQEAGIE